MLHRVLETDFVGLEADASVRIGPWGPVFQIALDAAAQVAELAADLVMAPGEKFDLQQMVSLGAFQIAVAKTGEFGTRTGGWGTIGRVSGRRDYVGLVLLLVADHIVFEQSLGGLGLGAAERPIGFVDAAVAEHRGEPLEGLARLGEDADAAHRTVETVRDAEVDFPRLGVTLRDEGLVAVCKALVACLVTLGDFAHALVDDEKMVVFIENAPLEVGIFCLCQCPVFHI